MEPGIPVGASGGKWWIPARWVSLTLTISLVRGSYVWNTDVFASLYRLPWRKENPSGLLGLCQNTNGLNIYSVLGYSFQRRYPSCFFSEGSLLTWTLDSIFSHLLWDPGLLIITSLFSPYHLFVLDLQARWLVLSNRNSTLNFQMLYSTLFLLLATIQSVTLLSQPNSTKVSSIPAVFIFYHLFLKLLTLQLNLRLSLKLWITFL